MLCGLPLQICEPRANLQQLWIVDPCRTHHPFYPRPTGQEVCYSVVAAFPSRLVEVVEVPTIRVDSEPCRSTDSEDPQSIPKLMLGHH